MRIVWLPPATEMVCLLGLGRPGARLEALRRRATGLLRPRVLCMEWLDPPCTAGHWVPDMVELAGGNDELETPGGRSRTVCWQAVLDTHRR